MSNVSSGSESGRMKNLISLPRMLITSYETVVPWRGVYLTLRSAVFIIGDTDAIVPWTRAPAAGQYLLIHVIEGIHQS